MEYDVDKCTVEYVEEVYKHKTVTDLLEPILKNEEEHPMSSDMEQIMTINMVHEA